MRRRRARASSASRLSADASSESADSASSLHAPSHSRPRRPPRTSHLIFDACSALATATAVYFLAYRNGEWWLRLFMGAGVGATLFLALQSLPAVGVAELDAAEDAVIATIRDDAGRKIDVETVWTEFSSASVKAWRVHALHVRARSDTSAASTPPLVIVHGHSSGAAHWGTVLGAAVSDGCEAWAISLPGWGRTPMPPELSACGAIDGDSADLVAEMIDAFLTARGLSGRAVLLGHSFGGFITTRFAIRYPRAISHLILHSTAGLTPLQAGRNGFGALVITLYFSLMPPQAWARFMGRIFSAVFARLASFYYPLDNPTFPAYFAQLAWASAYGNSAGGGSELVRAQLRVRTTDGWWRRPTLPHLILDESQTALPVSIIWGTRDEINDPALVRLLHRHRPNVNVYWIARGLHNCAHSHSALFNEALFHAIHARFDEATARPAPPFPDVFDARLSPELCQAVHDAAITGCADAVVLAADGLEGPISGYARAPRRQARGPPSKGKPVDRAVMAWRPTRVCASCEQPLRAEKATWACGCGAWAFRASFDSADGEADWRAMVMFLDEVVHGVPKAFDALSSSFSARRPLRGRVAARPLVRDAVTLPHPPATPITSSFKRGRVWIVC